MTVLVTGGTGQLGRQVVDALLDAGHQVRAIVREPEPGLPAGVDLFHGDLADPNALAQAGTGTDAVFLLAGYTDEREALRRLAAAGTGQVILLSSGCVEGGNLDNSMVRSNAAAEIAVRDSDLSWTVLRPSGFMSNTLQWVDQLKQGDTVREPFPDVAVAMIDPTNIAAVVPAVLGPGHHGHSYRLTGPEPLRPADRVRLLGDVLGRNLRYRPESDDDAHSRMSETMPPQLVDAFFRFYRDGEYDDSHVTPIAADLLGRPPADFTAWAARHHTDFT
jgi:uncharacterized protein YbjT (DUF2867 family)